ncbi:Hypothetical protein R9X50_00474200 [Acrodontium crateriforme]|uniref:Type 1 phosphatases regulator n=1 Tax=Acrodontium crateriforme TaxID=150365 RepID=A0AAQ3RCX9_9PEZI|nr:Hypothetical protein R9X50_00474200 [Acrodontium crateriforme]
MASHPRTFLQNASGTTTPTSTQGSQTILQTDNGESSSTPSATLRLRAEPDEAPRVRWAEEVVDNEGMGRKSSKVCCIYHKPHQPGDSESESDSSSSDSDSDSEPDLSRAQKAGGKGKGRGRNHKHDHGEEGNGKGKGSARRPSPNAYERQPKHKSKREG